MNDVTSASTLGITMRRPTLTASRLRLLERAYVRVDDFRLTSTKHGHATHPQVVDIDTFRRRDVLGSRPRARSAVHASLASSLAPLSVT